MASRIVNSPISTLGLDPALRTAIRGFEKVVLQSVSSVEDFIPKLYKSKNFTPKQITYPIFSGIPDAKAWDGKSMITAESLAYLYDVTATTYLYGNSISYTYEMMKFDLYNVGDKLAAELGKSAATKRQKLAAAFFNGAFTTAGVDGQYFFDSDHPYAPNSGLSGTQSNLGSGALSLTTLLDACVKLRNMRDPLGRPMNLRPARLFVDYTMEPTAREILNIGMNFKSGTADNTVNPFNFFSSIEVVGYPYFSSTATWVLQASEFETYFNEMIPVTMMKPREDDAHGVKQDLVFSAAFWHEDWRQFIGYTA